LQYFLQQTGCSTTLTLNYEHNGNRIEIPVYSTAKESPAHYVPGKLTAATGDVDGKSRLLHFLASLGPALGLGKVVAENDTSENGDKSGVWTGVGISTLYTVLTWNKPNHKAEWWNTVGLLGLAYENPDDDGNGGGGIPFGGDPGEGTDDGSGSDDDQDDGNWTEPGNGDDGDQDSGNW